jgi:outer membrane autotransporter protein
VSLVGTVYDLRSQGDATAVNAEAGLGWNVARDRNFSVIPRVSLRYGRVDFNRTQEQGGPMALDIASHDSESLDGRAGVSINGHHGSLRPYVSLYYVHDFLNGPSEFSAGFVGTQAVAPFALASADKDWGEIAGGLSFTTGRVEIGVDVTTTVARDDVRNQSYRGRIGIRF